MERVLIFAPNWLGDAVMALPAIADVRRAFPAARVTVAARRSISPLFSLVRDVDGVVEIAGRAFSDRSSAGRNGTGFDVAFLFPNSFASALIAYRAGILERWGYRADWRAPLLTRAVPRPRDVHQVTYYQHLVAALGIANGTGVPCVDVSPEHVAAGATLLHDQGWDDAPLAAIAPGAAYGGAKRWPPERFGELARTLADDGIRTVMVGSAADSPAGREVEQAAGSTRIINLIGRTSLGELAGVFRNCRVVVSNDSGAMHLAAASGVPVTALFGPTDETATAPGGAVRGVPSALSPLPSALIRVVIHPVWCRPCMLRECPLDHSCMRGITVERVHRAAVEAMRP